MAFSGVPLLNYVNVKPVADFKTVATTVTAVLKHWDEAATVTL